MMIDLNKFTYYELESLQGLVEDKIKSHYSIRERYPHLTSFKKDKKEIEELMLLKVKINEFMKTLPQPSDIQRLKDGNKY